MAVSSKVTGMILEVQILVRDRWRSHWQWPEGAEVVGEAWLLTPSTTSYKTIYVTLEDTAIEIRIKMIQNPHYSAGYIKKKTKHFSI